MSRRSVYLIVAVAVLFHVGLFAIFGRMRALPKNRYIPPPNFGYAEETYKDVQTGEKLTYREIRVSTKLADPATIERMRAERAAAASSLPPAEKQ